MMRMMKHCPLLILYVDENFETMIAILTIVQVMMEVITMAIPSVYETIPTLEVGHMSRVTHMQPKMMIIVQKILRVNIHVDIKLANKRKLMVIEICGRV